MRRRRIHIPLAFTLLVPFAFANTARAQDVGLAIGSVPAAVELEDLDGNAVSLSQFVGKKPVLLEFWATWCPLCAELEPRLTAAKKKHGDKLDIVIIAVGVNQTTRSIKRHVESHALPGRVLFDARGRATRAYQAPTTSYIVALDVKGRVVYTGVGSDQDIVSAADKAVASK